MTIPSAVETHTASIPPTAGGDDETIRLWEIGRKNYIGLIKADEKIRAVAFRPDGKHIAAGLYNGKVRKC